MITTFTAVVRSAPATRTRVGSATDVTIYYGPLAVARAVLDGTWNSEQALWEYCQRPERFIPLATYDAAVRLGMPAADDRRAG
jgi:hypothetical protein